MFKIFLTIIAPGSIIIPIAVFTARYRKMPSFTFILFIYLISSAVLNTTAIILALNKFRNAWLFNINTITESVLLLLFFLHIITSKKNRTLITWLLYVFPAYCLVNMLLIQQVNVFNTYTRAAEAIIFILLSVIYWWQADEDSAEMTWGEIASNWVVAGLMLYFAGGFFIFLLQNYLLHYLPAPEVKRALDIAWTANGAFILIMYQLFAIGFTKYKK